MVLTDLKILNSEANYSIIASGNSRYINSDKEVQFKKSDLKGDTVNFQFNTGPGIDTLTFTVTNITSKAKMIVTVTHLHYDNHYFIDLTTFKPGQFFFDWDKIDECQSNNFDQKLIQCEGKMLYQLKLKARPGDLGSNEIRPLDIKQFGISQEIKTKNAKPNLKGTKWQFRKGR